eukprot:bmy_08246T0
MGTSQGFWRREGRLETKKADFWGFRFPCSQTPHTYQMDLALLSTREGSAGTWSGRPAGIGAGTSSARSPARTRHAAFLGGCGSPAWNSIRCYGTRQVHHQHQQLKLLCKPTVIDASFDSNGRKAASACT